MTVIKDGAGGSQYAKVTSENKLCIRADSSLRDIARSEDGFRFAISSGNATLGAGFDGSVVRFENTDPDRDFYVLSMVGNWNGGNTNHNRALKLEVIKNESEPTGAATSFSPGNTNFGSPREALATAHKWDGTGSVGMTGGTGGITIATHYLTQGRTEIQLGGALIIPSGTSINLGLVPEEAGSATASLFGYYEDSGV